MRMEVEPNSATRVLLVDDNKDACFVTSRLLKHAGFHVEVCDSGAECIQIVQAELPDIILLDIQMPVMDGYAVCKFLRQQPWGRDLAIIAFTSLNQPSDTALILSSGFDGHLVKSAGIELLVETILRAVAAKKTA